MLAIKLHDKNNAIINLSKFTFIEYDGNEKDEEDYYYLVIHFKNDKICQYYYYKYLELLKKDYNNIWDVLSQLK